MAGKKGKKFKVTKAFFEAGEKNLAKWLDKHPERGAVKHGAYSSTVRKRYTDMRTTEGKQLQAIIDGLIDDLGGKAILTAAQNLLLQSIRSKLIVVLQISKFADCQISLVNSDGELLPCLKSGYTTYSESVRRDLEALFSVKRKAGSLSYETAMKALEVKR
ncbi:MAG: hypothetical protein L6406_25200 [Desulfobacterales bacterium]|nr:hypothetical protein [Desulfobacterales bacterium]